MDIKLLDELERLRRVYESHTRCFNDPNGDDCPHCEALAAFENALHDHAPTLIAAAREGVRLRWAAWLAVEKSRAVSGASVSPEPWQWEEWRSALRGLESAYQALAPTPEPTPPIDSTEINSKSTVEPTQ